MPRHNGVSMPRLFPEMQGLTKLCRYEGQNSVGRLLAMAALNSCLDEHAEAEQHDPSQSKTCDTQRAKIRSSQR
jgi:hypothetical protein